jgi:hypothetical protein
MWYVVYAIIAVFGVLLWRVLSLATNSYVRAEIEKHPHSIAYWYIKVADQILKATAFRPVFKQQHNELRLEREATTKRDRDISNLHDFAGVSETIFIRQSFSVSIDLSRKIPPFFIRQLGNPGFPIVLMLSLLVGFAIFTYLILMLADVGMDQSLLVALITAFLVSVPLVIALYGSEKSLLRILGMMHLRPHNVIIIDDKIILAETMLTKSGFRNKSDLVFVPVTGAFVKGVRIDQGGRNSTELFVYPSIFEDVIMNDGELMLLCDRLNKLVSDARALPKVKYDEIRV